MTTPPTGTVTFLFTDVEGSTVLWDRHPDAMSAALAEHDRIVRHAVERRGGFVFTTAGDSFSVAFRDAGDAVDSALEAQLALRQLDGEVEIRVRMGIHTGRAAERNGDYFGTAVNRCARMMSAGHGGQLLISGSTRDVLADRLPTGVDLVDLGVHRLRDLADPEHIFQVCHPDLDREFAKLRTLEGPGDTLPTQLTSFVGRDGEIDEVVSILRSGRLVTLAGPGGAGKTRLSLAVADHALPEYPDGVRLVELAALRDRDVLVDEVAQRFGASTTGDESLTDAIGDTINTRRMLLILDNCEHLVEPAALLVSDLLQVCPNLRVIATSRERLAITGEVIYRVPSLSMPAPDTEHELDIDALLGFDAIRLFTERAQLVDPHFELLDDDVDHVVAICRRLDGIPLALELAAARVRSMSLGQIAERLDERFRLLTGTDRSRDDRQQTLHNAIEWSYGLLDDSERSIFRRLAVFVSGFGLEAAEAVCAGGAIDDLDVIDLLTSLVDKSMIATTASASGTRYQLLESIRAFASDHLDDVGETAVVAERHCRHFAVVAAGLQQRQRAGDLATALAGLAQDEDNFRAALRWSIDAGDAVLAARMVDGLGYLWYAAGVRREGLEWCEAVLALPADLPDQIRAGALHSHALMLSGTGAPERGIAVLREQVTIRRRLDDPLRLGAALNNLGNLLHDVGRPEEAEQSLREAIEAFREGGAAPTMMLCSLAAGNLHAGAATAEDLYREALSEARSAEDPYGIALSMNGLGEVLVKLGRTSEARETLVEARERFEELSVPPGVAEVDMSLALLHRSEGAPVDAARCLLDSITSTGEPFYDQAPIRLAQYAASVIDDLPTAATLIGAAEADYGRRQLTEPRYVIDDLAHTRARLEQQLGDEEFARCLRAGGRRTRAEVIDITTRSLRSFIERAQAGDDRER